MDKRELHGGKPWDCYAFEPSPDITPFEMALIWRVISPGAPFLYVEAREADELMLPMDTARRHFRQIGKAIDPRTYIEPTPRVWTGTEWVQPVEQMGNG